MRVFSPEREVVLGINKIEETEGPTKAYLALARRNAVHGVGKFVATAPYFAALSGAEVARDIYTSGEIQRFLANQDMYAYHHPLNYVSGVFFHDPVALALAAVPLAILGLHEGAALVRSGQAVHSAIRRSRANSPVAVS